MARSLQQEFLTLRKKKRIAEEKGRAKKAADAEFKQHQGRLIQRVESMPVPDGEDPLDFSMKYAGTLFSVVQKIKASVDDRSKYVQWALEGDEGVQQFLAEHGPGNYEEHAAFVDAFYALVKNLELLELKEKSDPLNQLVRTAIEDGEILPPGATFRPDNYISQRAA